ncbi:MAG: hypothetical protein HRT44_12450, partial [Bdellovibrionales bacterium]|nr:hypothetical protein [Bdellovibrionales bacterium]NQZ20049.1 hypothetical protein [Bdellovibrionales bacterium]
MNIKGLKLFALFISSICLTMLFQNCGESTAKDTSSNNNGGLQVQVDPGINGDGSGGDGSGDPTGNPNEFSFDMNRGDSILYVDGGGLSLDLRSLRVLQKSFYVIAESLIYESGGQAPNPDLSANYCQNSAFPHCLHLNSMSCMGEGCPDNRPVACHWETRMSNADINNAFGAVNNLVFLSKIANSSQPFVADCDNPNLFFYSDVSEDVVVSLANVSCVPEGKYYASQGGDNMAAIFDAELDAVENAGDACNNYASYNWQNTKWTY